MVFSKESPLQFLLHFRLIEKLAILLSLTTSLFLKRGGDRLLTKYEILDIIIIDEKPEICSCVTHEAGKHYSKNIPETFENCCLNISDSCIGDALGCLDELENCGYRENEFITREMGENKSTTPEKLMMHFSQLKPRIHKRRAKVNLHI